MRGIDARHAKGARCEIVARHVGRQRARQHEQERKEDRTPRERDRGSPADDDAPARVDEQQLAGLRRLDGVEVGVADDAAALQTRHRLAQLRLEGHERASEQAVGCAVHRRPRALQRSARLRGEGGTHGDLGLHEPRHREHVGRQRRRRGHHLGDDVTRLGQSSKQHLGASHHEPLHRCVARVPQAREVVRRRPRAACCPRGIAVGQLDLGEGCLDASAREQRLRELAGALERGPREVEIAELRIRDAAKGQAERVLGPSQRAERDERVTARERLGGRAVRGPEDVCQCRAHESSMAQWRNASGLAAS